MATFPKIFLPRVKLVLDYGEKLHNLLYVYDPSSKQVRPITGKSLTYVRITMVYSFVNIVGQMVAIFLHRNTASFMQLFIAVLNWYVYLFVLFLLRLEWSPNWETVQLLNLLCNGVEQNGKSGIS